MKNVIVGGQYMLGALIVGTLWSLAAMAAIDFSAEQVIRNAIEAQAEEDRGLLEWGPGTESEKARHRELLGK